MGQIALKLLLQTIQNHRKILILNLNYRYYQIYNMLLLNKFDKQKKIEAFIFLHYKTVWFKNCFCSGYLVGVDF